MITAEEIQQEFRQEAVTKAKREHDVPAFKIFGRQILGPKVNHSWEEISRSTYVAHTTGMSHDGYIKHLKCLACGETRDDFHYYYGGGYL